MAIWAEIKKALNSTLGTSNFKSLDVLITSAQTAITNAVNTVNTTVNTINTNASNAKTYTATNNTASATGTLSQKLSYLINQRQASLTGTGTTVFTATPFTSTTSVNGGCPAVIGKFVAPIEGVYSMALTATGSLEIHKAGDGYPAGTHSDQGYTRSGTCDPYYVYRHFSVGSVSTTPAYGHNTTTSSHAISDLSASSNGLLSNAKYIGVASEKTINFYCKLGEPVVIVAIPRSSGTYVFSCSSIKITYQGR